MQRDTNNTCAIIPAIAYFQGHLVTQNKEPLYEMITIITGTFCALVKNYNPDDLCYFSALTDPQYIHGKDNVTCISSYDFTTGGFEVKSGLWIFCCSCVV